MKSSEGLKGYQAPLSSIVRAAVLSPKTVSEEEEKVPCPKTDIFNLKSVTFSISKEHSFSLKDALIEPTKILGKRRFTWGNLAFPSP